MKEIQLTKGYVALVDDEDYPLLSRHNWHAQTGGNTMYAVKSFRKHGERYHILMHRLIMPPGFGMDIDHIDGNGLNNQKSNLRECTDPQNAANRKKPKNNTSGYLGVAKPRGKAKSYVAKIVFNRKAIYIGSYPTAEEAFEAYMAKKKELCGQFAPLRRRVI